MSYRRWKPVRYVKMQPEQPLSGNGWSTTHKVLIGVGAVSLGLLLYTNWKYVSEREAAPT